MVIVMVLWAGNFIVVKSALGTLPPVGFTAFRYGLASLSLLALMRWRDGAIRLPHGDIRSIALLGIIGFGVYQILWVVALQTIPAGDSALLIATTPVMTALLAMATGADSPNRVKLVGAILSFLGVATVIVAGQGLNLGASVAGDLLTLGAAGGIGLSGAAALTDVAQSSIRVGPIAHPSVRYRSAGHTLSGRIGAGKEIEHRFHRGRIEHLTVAETHIGAQSKAPCGLVDRHPT